MTKEQLMRKRVEDEGRGRQVRDDVGFLQVIGATQVFKQGIGSYLIYALQSTFWVPRAQLNCREARVEAERLIRRVLPPNSQEILMMTQTEAVSGTVVVLSEFDMFWRQSQFFCLFLVLSEMVFEGEQNRRMSIVYIVAL